MGKRITTRREVLLVEIERRCAEPFCNARTRVGLTKEEARVYTGFKCERCEAWNDDTLGERDIPDWWEELKITDLEGLRPRSLDAATDTDEPGEVVARLSDAWRSFGEGRAGSDERDGSDARDKRDE